MENDFIAYEVLRKHRNKKFMPTKTFNLQLSTFNIQSSTFNSHTYLCAMNKQKVFARETLAIATHLVLPENTNTLGNLMGGQLLNWMDVISAISAHRHCRRIVVTAAVNNVSFQHPIKLGDIVTIEAKVSRSFNSSMEVYMEVFVEHAQTGERAALVPNLRCGLKRRVAIGSGARQLCESHPAARPIRRF